jgi:hypothetical protein
MPKSRRLPIAGAILLSLIVMPGGEAMSYEEPEYEVAGASGPVEFRRYADYLMAETIVEEAADFESAGNEGFRRLFKYISGANTLESRISMTAPVSQSAPSEKIAMTVPVRQEGTAAGWRVSFMLPARYTLATAPRPTDSRVRLVAVPARTVAALRYSGRWTEDNYRRHRDELLRALSAAGNEGIGEPWLARYNAPFTLPILRRNEVLIEVDRAPAR